MKKQMRGVIGALLGFSLAAPASSQLATKNEPSVVSAVAGGSASVCDGVDGNLVQNCGFETGDFTSWTQTGDTKLSNPSMACAEPFSVSRRRAPARTSPG